MTKKYLIGPLVTLFLVACGPTWNEVIKHPDGTLEDPKTHECWRWSDELDSENGVFPVECPRTEESKTETAGMGTD